MKKKMVASNVRKIENNIFKTLGSLDRAIAMYDCMDFNDGKSAQEIKKIKRYRDELLDTWGHFRSIAEQIERTKLLIK